MNIMPCKFDDWNNDSNIYSINDKFKEIISDQ